MIEGGHQTVTIHCMYSVILLHSCIPSEKHNKTSIHDLSAIVLFHRTFVGEVSGLEELGGECAVGILMGFFMPRLSVFSMTGPQNIIIGRAGRNGIQQNRDLQQRMQKKHDCKLYDNCYCTREETPV